MKLVFRRRVLPLGLYMEVIVLTTGTGMILQPLPAGHVWSNSSLGQFRQRSSSGATDEGGNTVGVNGWWEWLGRKPSCEYTTLQSHYLQGYIHATCRISSMNSMEPKVQMEF